MTNSNGKEYENVHMCNNHFAVQQKLSQHCKQTINYNLKKKELLSQKETWIFSGYCWEKANWVWKGQCYIIPIRSHSEEGRTLDIKRKKRKIRGLEAAAGLNRQAQGAILGRETVLYTVVIMDAWYYIFFKSHKI